MLMAAEKIWTYSTPSVLFLPGRSSHACSGMKKVLIPEGGGHSATMAHDTMTCDMLAGAREGSAHHLLPSSCWVVGMWRMFVS